MHARPVDGDVTLKKKHYTPADVFIAYMKFITYRGQKLHFEIGFQKFAFSGPQTLLSCK